MVACMQLAILNPCPDIRFTYQTPPPIACYFKCVFVNECYFTIERLAKSRAVHKTIVPVVIPDIVKVSNYF